VELRHLEYFIAVAEERNFTRAAERLHVVQSGVSAVIKALERDLGAQLLERDSKRVELTDAGRALLPKARAALDAAQDARDAVGEVEGGLRGTLRIGTLISVALVDVPALLGAYHRRHPGVMIMLRAAPSGSEGLVAALADGSLDLAFVSLPSQAPAGIRVRELASAPLDLVVPADHRLADREEVALADIAGEMFVDFPVGYGNRAVTDRAFASAGLHRQVSVEITDIAAGAAYVRHGLGVALLPRFVIRRRKDLRRLAVTGADLNWPLGLAMSQTRRPSAAARAMIEMITTRGTPAGAGT
jgi:DNA-binding transcriptional LysR family regulator